MSATATHLARENAELRARLEAIEARATERDELYRALTHNSPDLLLILDPTGRIEFMSSSLHEDWGKPSFYRGQSAFDHVHPDDRESAISEIRALVETERPGRVTYRARTQAGEWRWVQTSGQTFRNARGELRIAAVSRDIASEHFAEDALRAEKRSLERQVRRADRLSSLGTFAAGVAHEINNSLAMIRLATSTAAANLERAPEAARQALDDIERRIRRSANIVQNVLQFSREQLAEHARIDLNELASSSADLTKLAAVEHQVAVVLECGSEPLWIAASFPELEQMVVNLILNALSASEIGDRVRVSTRSEDRVCSLRVADTGSGIDPEHLARIFDPFFTTRGPGEGTGLGLAVVHGIVAAHGARISVDSEVGRGTVFTVEFARQASAGEEELR